MRKKTKVVVTINLAALFGALLSGAGFALIAAAELNARNTFWIGLALALAGHALLLDCRMAAHARRLADRQEEVEQRELMAYERGRLRGV